MINKLLDHTLSILFVTSIFVILLLIEMNRESDDQRINNAMIESYTNIQGIDFNNPVHRTLFSETLNLFYPKDRAKNDSLLQAIESYRLEQSMNRIYKSGIIKKRLSWSTFMDISQMYLNFVLIYLIVIGLSYYSVQTLATYYFVKQKQNTISYSAKISRLVRDIVAEKQSHNLVVKNIIKAVVLLLQALFIGLVNLVLFSPAYIIAYSLKSTFETGGYIFMIVLGVISNGILINYAYKFYTFLFNENRKGYVENAIVKGLNNSYAWNTPDGISIMDVLKLKKSFPSHVFNHIYANARYQYIPTMKQYASFLITGLIIIEMALNIQGHLCYELLQNILYRHYDIVLVIIFGIYIVVKATEILVDYWFYHESQKYENN